MEPGFRAAEGSKELATTQQQQQRAISVSPSSAREEEDKVTSNLLTPFACQLHQHFLVCFVGRSRASSCCFATVRNINLDLPYTTVSSSMRRMERFIHSVPNLLHHARLELLFKQIFEVTTAVGDLRAKAFGRSKKDAERQVAWNIYQQVSTCQTQKRKEKKKTRNKTTPWTKRISLASEWMERQRVKEPVKFCFLFWQLSTPHTSHLSSPEQAQELPPQHQQHSSFSSLASSSSSPSSSSWSGSSSSFPVPSVVTSSGDLHEIPLDSVTLLHGWRASPKQRLLNLALKVLGQYPDPVFRDHGPQHAKSFEATFTWPGGGEQMTGTGHGGTKREAERNACVAFLTNFEHLLGIDFNEDLTANLQGGAGPTKPKLVSGTLYSLSLKAERAKKLLHFVCQQTPLAHPLFYEWSEGPLHDLLHFFAIELQDSDLAPVKLIGEGKTKAAAQNQALLRSEQWLSEHHATLFAQFRALAYSAHHQGLSSVNTISLDETQRLRLAFVISYCSGCPLPADPISWSAGHTAPQWLHQEDSQKLWPSEGSRASSGNRVAPHCAIEGVDPPVRPWKSGHLCDRTRGLWQVDTGPAISFERARTSPWRCEHCCGGTPAHCRHIPSIACGI